MKKKPAVKKISDLKDKLDAYQASALAAGKGPARTGNLALASAAAGGAALAIAPAAEATIQYNGLRNILVTDRTENIDLDDDGVTDLDIIQSFYTIFYNSNIYSVDKAFISPQKFGTANIDAEAIASPGGTNYVKALSGNYNIVNDTTTFLAGPGTWRASQKILGTKYGDGNFPDAGNKYIGVRFTNATGEHFGWVQVSVAADSSSVEIIDWAWEKVPGEPILAGATTGGAANQVIPTLNEWGIIVLMTLLAGAAAWKMNKPELLQA